MSTAIESLKHLASRRAKAAAIAMRLADRYVKDGRRDMARRAAARAYFHRDVVVNTIDRAIAAAPNHEFISSIRQHARDAIMCAARADLYARRASA